MILSRDEFFYFLFENIVTQNTLYRVVDEGERKVKTIVMMMTRTKLTQLVPLTHFPKCSLKTAANCGGKMSTERGPQLELPEELSKNVIVLSCDSTAKGGVCDVYVVGTNHFSKVN
jgi:hypothetical protein